MNFLLRAFTIETLIGFVKEFLIGTIKNPTSAKAQRVRYYVEELKEVVDEFLARTAPPSGGPFPQ